MALYDHSYLVVSLPSDVSELLTVSEHTGEVEMTHVPVVETPSVNPSSLGFTTLAGINSVSLDLGMANQVGQVASSSALQTTYRYTNPLTMGSFLRPPPPILNSGLVSMGPQYPMVTQPFSGLTGTPGGIVPPIFLTFSVNPQISSMGSGGTCHFPPFGYWIGSTSNFFTESRTSIFSSQPFSSFLDWVVPAPFGGYPFRPFYRR